MCSPITKYYNYVRQKYNVYRNTYCKIINDYYTQFFILLEIKQYVCVMEI